MFRQNLLNKKHVTDQRTTEFQKSQLKQYQPYCFTPTWMKQYQPYCFSSHQHYSQRSAKNYKQNQILWASWNNETDYTGFLLQFNSQHHSPNHVCDSMHQIYQEFEIHTSSITIRMDQNKFIHIENPKQKIIWSINCKQVSQGAEGNFFQRL